MNNTFKLIFRTAGLLLAAAVLAFLLRAYQDRRRTQKQASQREQAVELSNQAVEVSQKGDPPRAVGLLKQALLLAPGDSILLANLTTIYGNMMVLEYQKGDFRKVLELGAAARRDSVFSATIYYLNAQAFCLDNRNDSAVSLLATASRKLPDNRDIAGRLAELRNEALTEQDFQQDRSGNFEIRFEGTENSEISGEVLMLLEEIRDRVGSELGHRIRGNTSVILYSDQQFRDITHLASWAGAAFDGRIRIPVANYQNDRQMLKNVLTHEFTHAAIYDLTGGRCPAWLNEGLAMLLEGINPKEQIYIPLKDLQKPFTGLESDQALLAYKASLSAAYYLTSQYDWAFVRLLFSKMQQGSDFGPAFKEAYGISLDEFEKRWKESVGK